MAGKGQGAESRAEYQSTPPLRGGHPFTRLGEAGYFLSASLHIAPPPVLARHLFPFAAWESQVTRQAHYLARKLPGINGSSAPKMMASTPLAKRVGRA